MKHLRWDLIDSEKWKFTDADKQSRMAEVLVHRSVDLQRLSHIIVWNDSFRKYVEEMFSHAGLKAPRIEYDSHHYYTKFTSAPGHSLVTGPIFTKRAFDKSVEYIEKTGQNKSARFKSIGEMLAALRNNFGCLPETAELIGLESENEMHTEDAGEHTLSVVRSLLKSDEYKALNPADKRLTELAAFLHDIGKGPKSRWTNSGGKQKIDPDHPIGSVEMLRRILTEEVAQIKPRSIRVLAKLLCYHDLVGDILGKGRKREQLEEIAGSERELNMLIALGLADMEAIVPAWRWTHQHEIEPLRAEVLAKLSETTKEEED